MHSKILVLGAGGQIGTELTHALRSVHGRDNIIASDIKFGNDDFVDSGPFEIIDATDFETIKNKVLQYDIDVVYLMAAMLSATGEKYPAKAWHLNMTSLFNVLDLAKDGLIKQIFWPSSIAVFGPLTPKDNTPQVTVMEPTTVYGITKQVGERWCQYYYEHYGVDVRSIRYPGIISWKTLPGGGTTDYAIDIYHKAITENKYDCFLAKDTMLPMMFMDDAVRAAIELMNTDSANLRIRSSYNLAAISFTPEEIFESIKEYIAEFEITYNPDFRQVIASTWPNSIDDMEARLDWNWNHEYGLEEITKIMLKELQSKKEIIN